MQSVLGEISKLRNGVPISIDYHNSNRYRVVVYENNGTKTAYYFGTPIYNKATGKMLDVKFQLNGDAISLIGSNSNITLSNNVLMKNAEGTCIIDLPQKCSFVSSKKVNCGNLTLFPTSNGIAFKCTVKANENVTFVVSVGEPLLNIRANNKCFALMKERFTPFVVFSCIGCIDATGNVISPAKIAYQKLTDKRYKIDISAMSPLAKSVVFEINLYENKLFQDTTVESRNPSTNNAFGSIGFIGNSSVYGEQWLYSRPDYSRITEIMDKQIKKTILHIPKFNRSKVELRAYKVSSRFCSFGSNWNNKIAESTVVADSSCNNGYQSLDITPLLVNQRTKTITMSEGIILKSKIKGTGFSAIATGDSCLAPQILEINFR